MRFVVVSFVAVCACVFQMLRGRTVVWDNAWLWKQERGSIAAAGAGCVVHCRICPMGRVFAAIMFLLLSREDGNGLCDLCNMLCIVFGALASLM
jgi:hypothetical protein